MMDALPGLGICILRSLRELWGKCINAEVIGHRSYKMLKMGVGYYNFRSGFGNRIRRSTQSVLRSNSSIS